MAKPVRPLVPPDGGWGWMVVLGVAVCNATTQSLLSVYGLLFADTLEEMGAETTGASVISNSMVAITNFSGLMLGPIMRHFSYRQVAMAGGVLVAVGMFVTSMAREMWHLFISYSVLVGLGLGLLSPSTFVAVNAFFTRARGRAVGLSLAGTGLGQMLMPHAVRFLLDEYSFRGAVLVLSAVALHSLAGAMLFHPLHWHARPATLAPAACSECQALTGGEDSRCSPAPPPHEHLLLEDAAPEKEKDGKEYGGLQTPAGGARGGCWERWVRVLDLDLLADPAMVSLQAGLAAVYTAGVNFNMLFPFFLAHLGLPRSDVALCMSLMAGMDIASRLLLPLATDRARVPARLTFLAGALALAASRSLVALQRQLPGLLATSALCGFVRAATTVNLNLTVSENCSPEKLPGALGINMVLKGISILFLGLFIGWLRDATGSYTLCMHVLSLMVTLPMLVWLTEMWVQRRRRRHPQQPPASASPPPSPRFPPPYDAPPSPRAAPSLSSPAAAASAPAPKPVLKAMAMPRLQGQR